MKRYDKLLSIWVDVTIDEYVERARLEKDCSRSTIVRELIRLGIQSKNMQK